MRLHVTGIVESATWPGCFFAVCLNCLWVAWLMDRTDAERFAARHVALTARREGEG